MQLSNDVFVIRVEGNAAHVVRTFLKIFLAEKRLTDKQLEATTSLVIRYTEYVTNGVPEPYASTILFSPDTRKDVSVELGISSAHLNNTFTELAKKDILLRESDKYHMNPNIVPNSTLTFKFKIVKESAKQG